MFGSATLMHYGWVFQLYLTWEQLKQMHLLNLLTNFEKYFYLEMVERNITWKKWLFF